MQENYRPGDVVNGHVLGNDMQWTPVHPTAQGGHLMPRPDARPVAAPPVGGFCTGCGSALVSTAVTCPQCGTPTGTPKDKSAAVLLAVFLGFWSWLYTYRRDAAKFWVALAVNLTVGMLLWVVLSGWLVWLPFWLWAVIDAASRPDSFYRQFPNG